MTEHKDNDCRVPFCKECLCMIKALHQQAKEFMTEPTDPTLLTSKQMVKEATAPLAKKLDDDLASMIPTLLDSELDAIFQRLDKKIANGITLSIIRDEVFDTDPIINVAKSDIKALIATIGNEVIGQDEPTSSFYTAGTVDKYARNKLRATQRAKLQELIK